MTKKGVLYRIFADNQRKNSWASKAHNRQFNLFLSHLEKLPRPVSILDVGETHKFSIELHFVFPLFHYLPHELRVWLTSHFALGHYPKASSLAKAKDRIQGFRLLTKKEMKILFSDANLFHEKVLVLTKLFIAYRFTSS